MYKNWNIIPLLNNLMAFEMYSIDINNRRINNMHTLKTRLMAAENLIKFHSAVLYYWSKKKHKRHSET